MAWQKCPICLGTGKTYSSYNLMTSDICTTCKGSKIISELTGLPPAYTQKPEVLETNSDGNSL